MLIRMKTIAMGPKFAAQPGDIVDHEDGQAMIEGGHAEAVDEAMVERMVAQAKAPAARRGKSAAAKRETR